MPGPELAAVERNLRAGIAQPPEAVHELVQIAGTAPDRPSRAWVRRDCVPEPEIEIAVLGPVEVRGAAREFTRAGSLDLVVYLALHPEGVDRNLWAEVMWPGRTVPRPTLDSTVSVARSALGIARDGSRHFPTGRGKMKLGPGVTSDWDKFVELSKMEGAEARAEALGLIRGRLFEGLKNADWILYEGVSALMESRVVDVAITHATECLEAGDAGGAEWAARQGIIVSPYDERLYRLLMQAADAAGNRATIVAIMAELRAVVYEDVIPADTIHPETEALFRRLTGRSAQGIGSESRFRRRRAMPAYG